MARSFAVRKDPAECAWQTGDQPDRVDLPADSEALQLVTLREMVERYRDAISI